MATVICPACGHKNDDDRATCENCGVNFARLAAKSPAATPKKKSRGWLVFGLILATAFACVALFTLPGNDEPEGGEVSPTATPATSPEFGVFATNYESMTDTQFEAFARTARGNRVIDWEGVVSEVDEGEVFGGHTVYVRMNGEPVASVYIEVAEDVALEINRGDTVQFSGTISLADNSLGLTIRIENATVTVQ